MIAWARCALLRIRLFMVEQEIRCADSARMNIHADLADLHTKRHRLCVELLNAESDRP